MNSAELRKKFIDFYLKKQHREISSVGLLAENDPSLLFVNSGMFPLVPYLAGQTHPQGKRLVNCQRSFRSDDIEEIGDNRHETMFEMLGVWSLGDYFKKEHLFWLYEFLIDEIKLDPQRLYQTVFAGSQYAPKDTEAIEILKNVFGKYGLDAEVGPETIGKGELGSGQEIEFGGKARIFPYRDKNWWKRGEAIGELGGPDSETFYDTGKSHNIKFGKYCHLNCDCGRFIEIGNSVFMEYLKTANGWEKKLPQRNVDFGGGFERLVMVANNQTNIFTTDLFDYLIKFLEKESGKNYENNYKSFEIIADHIRAATFLIADGGVPSNKDQGYIVRRLIRRALAHWQKLGIGYEKIIELPILVIEKMQDAYPHLKAGEKNIIAKIQEESGKFSLTLAKGLKKLEECVEKKQKSCASEIAGMLQREKIEFSEEISVKDAFDLYQTYGFPRELIEEELARYKMTFNKKEFDIEFKKHQDLSRAASAGKFKGGLADQSEQTTKYHTATHLLLESLRQVLGAGVFQRGSNITGERMRFDFSFPQKLAKEQIQKVEDLVNEQIGKNLPVIMSEMSLIEAQKLGAMGIFGNKYGERVKVYTIGDETTGVFSREICGGPHISSTGIMGVFKIKKEEAISGGVRRIKATLE